MSSKDYQVKSIIEERFKINVEFDEGNILYKETIKEAYEHPELYGNMTIRISGYCVAWGKLTDEQRKDIYNRTLHESL